MIKKILVSSLLGLSLMMSGCGDTEGEERLEVQQMLDAGNFAGVISKLEGSADSQDDYIALGAAYMGKAGLSLTNIITSMVSSVGGGDNAFAGFVTGISSSSSVSALPDLSKAVDNYTHVVGAACLNPNLTLTNSQKDICLYIGLASTSSAAVAIDLISGDITSFGDDTQDDEKLTASVCGINYAFDRTESDCNVTESADVNFTIINKLYKPLVITVNSDTDAPKTEYHYLMNDTNQTVLTKNFCQLDNFSRYEDINATSNLYACPINESPSSEEFTTAGVLVDVLNDGIGSIGGAAADENMQSDIDEFKCEILGGTYSGSSCSGADITNDVSEQNIIDYLNSQN